MDAAGALQRRFLIGPLVVLALLGPAGDVTVSAGRIAGDGVASPTPTPTVDPTRAKIMDALEAEQVYRVDRLVFAAAAGSELEQLQALDPSVGWGTEVIVEVPADEDQDSLVVVLRAPLAGGGSLCLSEVTSEQDAGLWFARVPGDDKCPKIRRGMRGWSPDESGWD